MKITIKQKNIKICLLVSCLLFFVLLSNDSSDMLPTIVTSWTTNKLKNRSYVVKSTHLWAHPFFSIFDYNFFKKHMIIGDVTYRYQKERQIASKNLGQCIIRLLNELALGKRSYTDFTVLKKVDFSVRKCCGSLILKFKKYPFVLKIFIEKPHTLLNPFQKGLFSQSFFHYIMGHGMSRHLNGFTRIKNLHKLKQAVAKSFEWCNKVTFPRKWFWIPPKDSIWYSWITIKGYNFESKKQQICIPAVYGVIADFIDMEKFSWFNAKHRKKALTLCNYVQMSLDQNVNNFAFEKQTGRIVIVDTENFYSLIGWSGKPYIFTSYPAFWLTLGWKIVKDTIGYGLQLKMS